MVKEAALLVSAPILLTCSPCLSHCIKSSDGVSAGGRRIGSASCSDGKLASPKLNRNIVFCHAGELN